MRSFDACTRKLLSFSTPPRLFASNPSPSRPCLARTPGGPPLCLFISYLIFLPRRTESLCRTIAAESFRLEISTETFSLVATPFFLKRPRLVDWLPSFARERPKDRLGMKSFGRDSLFLFSPLGVRSSEYARRVRSPEKTKAVETPYGNYETHFYSSSAETMSIAQRGNEETS